MDQRALRALVWSAKVVAIPWLKPRPNPTPVQAHTAVRACCHAPQCDLRMGTEVARWAAIAPFLNNIAEVRGGVALAHSGIMVEGVTEPAVLAGETESDGEEGVAPEGPLDPQRVYSKNRRLIRSAWEGSQKEIWMDGQGHAALSEGGQYFGAGRCIASYSAGAEACSPVPCGERGKRVPVTEGDGERGYPSGSTARCQAGSD